LTQNQLDCLSELAEMTGTPVVEVVGRVLESYVQDNRKRLTAYLDLLKSNPDTQDLQFYRDKLGSEWQPRKRPLGLFKGQFVVGPEFDDPLPEDELRLWNGGGD
jgi:hypothetical protein